MPFGIISREDVDRSLDDWKNIGFSDDSLNILKNRLYNNVIYLFEPRSRNHRLGKNSNGEYSGYDDGSHLLLFKDEKTYNTNTVRYHEIRHAAQQEIIRLLIDEESEIYKGMNKAEIRKIVEMIDYEISYDGVLSHRTEYEDMSINISLDYYADRLNRQLFYHKRNLFQTMCENHDKLEQVRYNHKFYIRTIYLTAPIFAQE